MLLCSLYCAKFETTNQHTHTKPPPTTHYTHPYLFGVQTHTYTHTPPPHPLVPQMKICSRLNFILQQTIGFRHVIFLLRIKNL